MYFQPIVQGTLVDSGEPQIIVSKKIFKKYDDAVQYAPLMIDALKDSGMIIDSTTMEVSISEVELVKKVD